MGDRVADIGLPEARLTCKPVSVASNGAWRRRTSFEEDAVPCCAGHTPADVVEQRIVEVCPCCGQTLDDAVQELSRLSDQGAKSPREVSLQCEQIRALCAVRDHV